MDTGQKIGTAILMGIPALIGSGVAMWLTDSWVAVIIWCALMPLLYWAIVTGRLSRSKAEENH